MGRFNWMWKAFQRPDPSWAGNQLLRITLIAASLLLSTQTATALSSNDDAEDFIITSGGCAIDIYAFGVFAIAVVTLGRDRKIYTAEGGAGGL